MRHYGPVMPFLDNSEDDLDLYIDVNCRTLLHLTHRFAGHLKTGRSGGIVLMSSLAGLWGTGLVAPYGASKAFDYNLAEALHYELVQGGHRCNDLLCRRYGYTEFQVNETEVWPPKTGGG